ncbi:multifunctional CCA addition/repair protein [Pseudomonadota bacterium]
MKVYQVGGAVRDTLLDLPVKDHDWVVVGTTPQSMLDQGYRQVGKDFPVFLHPDSNEEYALARTERKTGPGYTGFAFHASAGVTLEDDLKRRDLTINAMAMDDAGNIVDPFNGLKDLESKVLRHVSTAFEEDPVRILRLARFYARFSPLGFTIAEETMILMRRMVESGEVDALVPERVWQETQRALGEQQPTAFFEALRECGALTKLFPEIEALFGVPQRADYHPEIDTGIHTMMVLEQASHLSTEPRVRFAALLHDLGKAETPADVLPRHIGHESRSLPLVKQVCKRLKTPNDYRDLSLLVAKYHTHCHKATELRPATLLETLHGLDAFRRGERFEEFLLACEADSRGRTGFEECEYRQPETFRQALLAAQSVDAAALAKSGLAGQQLVERLKQARIAAIKQRLKN